MMIEHLCKVSVIVPVYNTESYLHSCLESLAAQTLKEIEVIVVDDGSTDRSLDIARKFEAENPWIFRVISITNHGPSYARNYGAEKSKGDYLAFVDSDDTVEPDYCKAMYEKAIRDHNDVVMCTKDTVSRLQGQIVHTIFPEIFWEQDNFRLTEYPVLLTKLSTGPWNKLVKRELFFSIKFPEDIHYAEDILYTVKLVCLAENIGIIPDILYHYYSIHPGLTSKFSDIYIEYVNCMKQTID